MNEELNVAFIGNPNCGKTTLFNAYTGAKLKVANWPGVTVEKKEGAMKYHQHKFKLVDLPGIYSLTCYTMEEKLSRQYILEDEVDVIVDIADASCLERNLYLALQLIELGKPVVLALNMMDIVQERGMEIDLHRLPEMLGIPCIPVSARKKTGLDILMHTVAHHKSKAGDKNLEHHHYKMGKPEERKHIHEHHSEYAVVYSDAIEDKIDAISEILQRECPGISNVRWHAIKVLEQDEEILEKYPADFSAVVDRSYETDIINEKYDFIEEIIEETVVNKASKAEATDRVDRFLTDRFFGLPIFLGIMAAIFFLTFAVGDGLKVGFDVILSWLSQGAIGLLEKVGAGEMVTSLVVDGILAGVGGILSFLPNIFILFLALAILEDSGYMARVAYVMDGIMSKIGLSGRAFIPMLLGFGCSVPAVMASRALETTKDRFRTVMVTPFMSCSARLPIYVLFSNIFFGKYAPLAAFSMYVLGLAVAVAVALAMNFLDQEKEGNTLLIELPEYKTPNGRTIFIYVWDKVKDYLTKAGTTIFVASVAVWAILNFGPNGMASDMSQSFGAIVGQWLTPILKPAGLGLWQVSLSLISGVAAKEVVVSSMAVLLNVGNLNSAAGMGAMAAALGEAGFGPVNAYAFMVFCLLYTPCIATVATIKRELNSAKWAAFSVVFQLVVAWAMAVAAYQVGSALF